MTGTTASQSELWQRAPFDAAFAFVGGWARYTASALRRGPSFSFGFVRDSGVWWSAATHRFEPTWSTPHTVAMRWPQAELLDFSEPIDAGVPTLILPPQAGHSSTIVDYSENQSQVRTARSAGLGRTYVLSWLGATDETSDSTIDDYIAIVDDAVAHLGGRVNLVGDCQGGWLAAIYAALRPEAVTCLVTAGAPIDFHAGESAVQYWVQKMSGPRGTVDLYRWIVDAGKGTYRGANQIHGFKMLEPAEELKRLSDLWANIHDPEAVKRYTEFADWFEWGQDLPGAFYLWIVEHLFVKNELIAGELVVDGRKVDLSAIDCPVYMLAGAADHITPPAQMFALAEHISTPSEHQDQQTVPGGHLGLFMGRAALAGAWTDVFAAIAAQNIPQPAAASEA
ncbi:alpha/beta fold hydrolase [Gordonia sp. TBRC 11910]|uniref:Alpha/beta fold hydrolase n=1 Tax=Gordonia asplenii TaxID=2725283 RepID=A0A848L1S9_9ACTN|nr:alpha/beta fold hydrolase [Gordonia asplenii]NMO04669.1 alpha/beta fold hydrolase [Gordonia asplenii]